MISLKLSFYTTLIPEFGEELDLSVEIPINFFELFTLFSSSSGTLAEKIFLEKDYTLNSDYNILLDGVNIEGYNGLRTIIDKSCEISFFHKVGGG